MKKFIVIQGTPADGFDYFGPFDTPNDAAEYVAADYSPVNWWVVPLITPTNPNQTEGN